MSGVPRAVPVALVPGATQVVKAAGPSTYLGIKVRETSAGACVLRIWDNASAASGKLLDIVVLASGGYVSQVLPIGIHVENGIFIERVSGTNYEGSVLIG